MSSLKSTGFELSCVHHLATRLRFWYPLFCMFPHITIHVTWHLEALEVWYERKGNPTFPAPRGDLSILDEE